MLRLFKEVTIPKSYEINCNVIDYFRNKYNLDNCASLLETDNHVSSRRYKHSDFARLLDAIKSCDEHEIHLIYTRMTGHSTYIGIKKIDDTLCIILVDPDGLTHAAINIHPIINQLRAALDATNQCGKIYISSNLLQHNKIQHEYFTHYIAEYFLKFKLTSLQHKLPPIKARTGNLSISVDGGFLPKELLMITQSTDILVDLLPDDELVNSLLNDNQHSSFSAFKATNLYPSEDPNIITNEYMRAYKSYLQRNINHIALSDPLKYHSDTLQELVDHIDSKARLDAVL